MALADRFRTHFGHGISLGSGNAWKASTTHLPTNAQALNYPSCEVGTQQQLAQVCKTGYATHTTGVTFAGPPHPLLLTARTAPPRFPRRQPEDWAIPTLKTIRRGQGQSRAFKGKHDAIPCGGEIVFNLGTHTHTHMLCPHSGQHSNDVIPGKALAGLVSQAGEGHRCAN